MIDKWCGLALGVIFAVVFAASANSVAETMSDGWTIESIDQDFITSAQLAWRFRFVVRTIAVFSAIGFVGAMLIVCYGAPGWRVLSLLLAVCAVLIVPRTEVSMERGYHSAWLRVVTLSFCAAGCWLRSSSVGRSDNEA